MYYDDSSGNQVLVCRETDTFTYAWESIGEMTPQGVITMWSGTLVSIPSGWALCDGTNGTPDLRDKFIYGCSAGQNPGVTGGSTSHSHTVNSHTHSIDPPNTTTSTCNTKKNAPEGSWPTAALYHTHTVDIPEFDSDPTSPGTSTENNLPPYYKLAFIMKL